MVIEIRTVVAFFGQNQMQSKLQFPAPLWPVFMQGICGLLHREA